ncbi:MAG TPA: hypothetical protein DEA08_34855, partial [Planctomycetes bacterium]|nr:hypothetical protein [Planctomycetota bacterium]
MNDNVFGPRDHRELAPRLGLQDAGAWTSAGRELLERLRASLERLFPAGSWSEQAPLETPWGLVEAGPALHGCATLAQLSGVAQRLARGLGLRPGRLEHPLELRLAETRFSPAPQVRADLRWQALDRWGTPVALLAAEPTNDSEWLDPASYPHVALSFRTATTPTLLARLLEQGPWPIWLAPESVRVLRLPGDQGALL